MVPGICASQQGSRSAMAPSAHITTGLQLSLPSTVAPARSSVAVDQWRKHQHQEIVIDVYNKPVYMMALLAPSSHQRRTGSAVIKGSNFEPSLNRQEVRSGRYLLPKRKLPPKLNQHRDQQHYKPIGGSAPCNVKYREIIDSRPPLRADLSTPGPWAYSPQNTKPLNETNAPSFTMRPKCWSEKEVGGRTSWSKTWYQSPEVWTSKVNFGQENRWPSPSTYDDKLRIGGEHQTTHARYPVYSMGHRYKLSLMKPGADKEPSPASYNKNLADGQVFTRAPTVIHAVQTSASGIWGKKDTTPGPGSYSPKMSLVKRSQPSFSVSRSSREGLEPLLGPFASS